MTLWTLGHQGPLSMDSPGKNTGGGSPCPPPGDLHDPGIEPSSRVSPALQVGSSPTVPLGKPSKTPYLGVKRCTAITGRSLVGHGQVAV